METYLGFWALICYVLTKGKQKSFRKSDSVPTVYLITMNAKT
jgi:hypothetical protein